MNNWELSAKNIIHAWCESTLCDRPQTMVFPNVYMGGYEGDIVEVSKAGYLYEYEVKISRADFFADLKKHDKYYKHLPGKHDRIKAGERVNRFIYVVPRGLVTVDEVPEYAGLIVVDGIREASVTDFRKSWPELRISTSVVKGAPKLSKEKLGAEWLPKLHLSTYNRFHARNRKDYIELINALNETNTEER